MDPIVEASVRLEMDFAVAQYQLIICEINGAGSFLTWKDLTAAIFAKGRKIPAIFH
jgi:hypothetical protein